MSTNHADYVIIGVDIGYDVACAMPGWDEGSYDSLQDTHEVGKMICLYDGMNGEYCIFGKLLAVANEYDGLKETLGFHEMMASANDVEMNLEEQLGIVGKPKLHIVRHFR